MTKKNQRSFEVFVPYFEFFEHETFAVAAWKASKGMRFFDRLMAAGIARHAEKRLAVTVNDFYVIKGRYVGSKVRFTVRPYMRIPQD